MDGSPSMSPLVVLESSAAARERGLHPDHERGRSASGIRADTESETRAEFLRELCPSSEFLRCNIKRNGGSRTIPDPPGTF